MSVKNKPFQKKVRALERALRKGKMPAQLDLVEWLKDHKYADTTGKALSLLYEGRVECNDHVVRTRLLAASLRPNITVKDGVAVSDEA